MTTCAQRRSPFGESGTQRFKYPEALLPSLNNYNMAYHHRIITTYRELPPKWRIIGEEPDPRSPTDRYLDRVDTFLRAAQARAGPGDRNDLVSFVFGNQDLEHELASRQLAYVVEERRALTQRHLRDVQWRLDELAERRPLRSRALGAYDDASLTEVERQIHQLEREKRALELDLWRDTHELRTELVKERQEREATRRRMDYLAGGPDGRS